MLALNVWRAVVAWRGGDSTTTTVARRGVVVVVGGGTLNINTFCTWRVVFIVSTRRSAGRPPQYKNCWMRC